MKSDRYILPAGIVTILMIGVSCHDLLSAWRNSPFDQWGWLVFGVWLILGIWLMTRAKAEGSPLQVAYLYAGLVLAFLGYVGDLNVLQHGGFAMAMAGFAAASRGYFLWLIGSVAWMPAWGWLGAHWFSAQGVVVSRGIVLMIMIVGVLLQRKGER